MTCAVCQNEIVGRSVRLPEEAGQDVRVCVPCWKLLLPGARELVRLARRSVYEDISEGVTG